MARVVMDASAILAFIKREDDADRVLPHIGTAIVSAVNLQEVVTELVIDGLPRETIEAIVSRLRLDVRPHDVEAAYAAGELVTATRQYGCGLGDRTCMALGLALGAPVLRADREWARVQIEGLAIEMVR